MEYCRHDAPVRAVRRVSSLVALAAAALLLASSVQADEPRPITLDEALALAERDNPEIAAARARTEGQEARRDAAARALWPRLSALADVSRTDQPARVFAEKLNRGAFGAADFDIARLNDPSAIGHATTMLSLEVPFDLAGTARARTRAESAGVRAAGAQLEEARQELRLHVIEAYGRAALAREAVSATEQALEGARSREAELAARVGEGGALPADLLRTKARRRQREADLAARRGDVDAALAGLARVLGAPPDARYAPAGPLPVASGDDARADLETWRARAADARGTLKLAAERRSAAGWARRGEQRSLAPSVAAYGQASDDRWSGDSRRSYAIGASLRWTLDPAVGRRVAAAKADERAADEDARGAAAQVRLDVDVAFARLTAAREGLLAARGGTEEGREALRVMRERRAAGLATLTDELETEAASLGAELDERRAETELAVAEAALRRAAGTLTGGR